MNQEGRSQTQQRRLFSVSSAAEKAALESELLKELDVLPNEIFADSASERLAFYVESKKVDADVYYESKYKPLEGDAANTEEAYAKLMTQAKVLEYGSNFDKNVYDPQGVVASPDELLDNILRRSVNKNINSIINRQPSQTSAAQQALNTLSKLNGTYQPPQPPYQQAWGYMQTMPPYQ